MTQSVYAENTMDTGFDATLRGVTLADLIQMKCFSGASESIRVTSGVKEATLHFVKGALSHASAGELRGDAAVLEILTWRTGSFEPIAAAPSAGSRISTPWQSLLLNAAKASDERSVEVPLLGQRKESGMRTSSSREKETMMNIKARPLSAVASTGATEVRLDASGHVLHGKGDYDELSAATAYILHVAGHIGSCLGLDPFRGFEFKSGDNRTVIFVDEGGEVAAVQSKTDTDVAEFRKRAGLE